MMKYNLPADLDNEISQLEELIKKYRSGEASQTELKAHRVPFGVYEQREPDTYMVRIRCAAGAVTPRQLEGIGAIASKYGVGDIHVTSRQELQIHYVKLDDIVSIIRDIKKLGLSTRGGGGNTVRNIIAPDDAGIDPDEEFDVSPYAFALTSRLIAESDSWNLPRKYKIAFSGSPEDKGYATISDIGFIAKVKDGKNGFRVYVAGGMGAKSSTGKLLFDFIEDREAYPVAKALKNVFFKFGNRKNKHAARSRFLWDSLGEEEFKRKFHEEYSKIIKEGFTPLEVNETENKTVIPLVPQEEPEDITGFAIWKPRFAREQKQKGLYSVLIPLRLGFISSERAIKLERFIKVFGDDVVRLTKNQNILLRNIPLNNLGNIYNFLRSAFEGIDEPAIYGEILSCTGAATCQLGICLSRQAAKALMRQLKASGLDLDKLGPVRFNISGCTNSCGQHPVADLGFSGKALRKEGKLYPAYNVLAGAVIRDGETTLAAQVGEISAKDLPQLVIELFRKYLSRSNEFKTFRDYILRQGKEDLKGLCAGFKDIPSFEEDKNYYFDWDSEVPFSLAERRGGECSAGLFDLLEMDLANIEKTESNLASPGLSSKEKETLLAKLVFYAARMLLITRGVEPKSEDDTYAAFIKHFLETGLIDRSHRDIISLAEQKDRKALLEKETAVRSLAVSVRELYEAMDNSFNFKTASAPIREGVKNPALSSAPTPVAVKDLRGVACPLNFVQTKVELSKLKEGDILEVWLDDGPPIENVPGSVKAEGHKIIEQKKAGSYWSVRIEKK